MARSAAIPTLPARGGLRLDARPWAQHPDSTCDGAINAGPHTNIDIAYGSLATYVSKHALAIDGHLREYYLVGQIETADHAAWRTEIGWPIFQTTRGT